MIQLTDLQKGLIAYHVGKPLRYDHSMRVQWLAKNGMYGSISELRENQAQRNDILDWCYQEFGKVSKGRWGWITLGDWLFDVGFNSKADMMLFKLRWS